MTHLRAAWRLCRLTLLVLAALPGTFAARSRPARARWQQRHACQVLQLLGARLIVEDGVPADGLIVSNHLGYLDALAIAAAVPTIFVAKRDVRAWPVVGWLCRMTNTIFVARDRRTLVRASLEEIDVALRAGVTVTLFPEGTSSGGDEVLPFKSSLLEAAQTHQATPAVVSYRLARGRTSEILCYWRDMTFVPHFWNVLRQAGFVAAVRFGTPQPPASDRKATARALHAGVTELQRRGQPSDAKQVGLVSG